MSVDPGQRHNVAAEHPDLVARLRQGYEEWWQTVSRQFDETIPIPVGEKAGEATLLNSHDWRNDPVLCAWNQSLVRQGLEANGYWEVEVAESGRYRFELRRWPRLEDRAISEGIPGEPVSYHDIKDGYGGGRAIPLTQARIRVADYTETVQIGPEDNAVVFEADLEAGEAQLQTYLSTVDGLTIGAYYVYVERLAES
jgi:hypothetical protein